MIDVKKAYSIVVQNNPGMEVNTCNEYADKYVFSLKPEGCKEGFANSAVYIVDKKTESYKVLPFWEVLGEPIIKEVDITEIK